MFILLPTLVVLLSLLLALFSYVNRLYSEKGRFLIRGSQDNVDFFEDQVEPKLKVEMEKAGFTFPLLVRVNLIVLAMTVAWWNLSTPLHWHMLVEAGVFLVLDVMLFAQVIPNVLLTRTSGKWLLSATSLLRLCVLLVFPLAAISRFLYNIATLGKETEREEDEPSASENIEALIQAGEEEGLIEEEDRKLIRSVVEFGDKTVREVMTPRPEIFAVPAETPLSRLKQMPTERRFSRIPIYQGDMDHILGFIHVRDLLPLSDEALSQHTVTKFLQPMTFVPETKPVAELLKEIQQKAQIAIVVDEYGSVAGLATVEDMVEEIVGEIHEEHEARDAIPQGDHSYSVAGSMDLDRLQELFGVRVEETGDATTVSGLVTGAMGRVPSQGETLEKDGLLFQVTESNGRRVLRLSISHPEESPPAPPVPPESTDSQNSQELV